MTLAFLAAPAPVVSPHRGDLLDVILIALAVGYAIVGFHRGLVVGALSFAGFIVGAVIGSRVGPAIANGVIGGTGHNPNAQDALGQRVLALVIVFVFAVAVESLGAYAGTWIRRAFWATPIRPLDAVGGAVLDVAGLLVVSWLLASALATAPFPHVVREIRRSAILNVVDKVMPQALRHLSADLDRLLQQHDLPSLLQPFAGVPVPPAALPPPDAGVVPPALHAAGPEIVKITGIANSCDRELEGSGFVISPQHIMTNAHVVAGVHNPEVALPAPGAAVLPARVVLYDPNRDVAVLYVPGLTRPALHFAGLAPTGASAVVAGYPENGPLTAVAARIAGEQDVTGPNIYANRDVTRAVYTLRAKVRPGNSGGPLLNPSGDVYGVVFAASVDEPDVGYALTSGEVSSDAQRGSAATASVSTEGCD